MVGCTPLKFFAANLPEKFNGHKTELNIDFDSTTGQKLDVYTPADGNKPHPVIVFFYGGRWTSGSKDDYKFVADNFTDRGYVVVIADYAKYPQFRFKDWQQDGAKAVAWTYKNIAHYGGNPKQLFVVGHSAGAHIGALLATNNKYLKAVGGNRNYIKAFVGLAGPYDFVPDEPDLLKMFEPAKKFDDMRVTKFVDGKQAPMLLLWGRDDKTVGEINITNLTRGLKKHGSKYEIKYYDGVDHVDIVAALASLAETIAPVADDIDAYFRAL